MKWSSTTIVTALIVVLIVLYGGYRLIRHFNKAPIQQVTIQQKTVAPSTSISPGAMSNEMTVNLAEENKSGESGTATLKEENGKTTVTLTLTGFTKGVAQPAHIHVGVCPGVGAVKYPLTDVVNGSSVTVLSTTLVEIKQNLPLAINVHKSLKEITNYTACGELSSSLVPSQTSTESPTATPTAPPTTAPQSKSLY